MNKQNLCRSAVTLWLWIVLLTACVNTAALAGQNGDARIPGRVISLSPLITETIFLLGAQDLLIANTIYCNVPVAAKTIEKVGSVKQADVERILSLQPDLVFTSPLTNRRQVEQMKRLGLQVVLVGNPDTFDAMCWSFLKIGTRLGQTGRAQEMISAATKKVSVISDQIKQLDKPPVFFQIGMKPLYAVSRQTFMDEYIRLAGGMNIFSDERSGIISREMVIAKNPQVILIAVMGSSKASAKVEKKKWMTYTTMRAVQHHRVHVLDPETLCSPTPLSFVAGLETIFRLLHPRETRKIDEN